ncbi:MAG: hypothetical protein ACFFG0_27620, partial [Candidatus Thorarchaeota archaeon]
MIKKLVYSVLAVLIASILVVPIGVLAHTAANPFVTDLVAGQNYDAGDIKVWNDAETLYVKYETADGWKLNETHLAVEVTLEAIAQTNSGSVKVGKFEFSSEHDPAVESYTYEIDIGDWYYGLELYLAAHAVVSKEINCGEYQEETGWGDGDEFDKNWAMYFRYKLQEPEPWKLLNIPEGKVKITPVYPGTSYGEPSYFDTTLSEVPDGYDVTNGLWDGWCVDSNIGLENGKTYEVNLYLSTDPNLPAYAKDDEQWNYVNYILNKDYSYLGGNYQDIQCAIWYFTDTNPQMGSAGTSHYTPEITQAIIDDALGNGATFIPGEGQWMAV